MTCAISTSNGASATDPARHAHPPRPPNPADTASRAAAAQIPNKRRFTRFPPLGIFTMPNLGSHVDPVFAEKARVLFHYRTLDKNRLPPCGVPRPAIMALNREIVERTFLRPLRLIREHRPHRTAHVVDAEDLAVNKAISILFPDHSPANGRPVPGYGLCIWSMAPRSTPWCRVIWSPF